MNRVTRRAQSVVSDGDANDGMAEIELQKLQRQYRIMEGDRKAYSEESRILIKKQRMAIQQLKNDNQYLIDEIRLGEARLEDSRSSGRMSKKAESLTEQSDLYLKKIRSAQHAISELGEAVSALDKDIASQRQKMGGMNATQNNAAIQKQIRILENRLDKAFVKFNRSLAINKNLRCVIDNLRRERAVFDSVHKKLQKELTEQKKSMAEIIEASNSAYETRDDAQAKIIALKEKADKEFQSYIQETKELERVLEQDRKLRNFMAIKASERNDQANSEERTPKKSLSDKDASGHKGSQENLSETVENYETAFEKIKTVTHTNDINELVKRFTQVEDQNFSLFNYVNEINNGIEILSDEIKEINGQIEHFREDGVRVDNERKQALKELEEKLSQTSEKTGQYEQKHDESLFILEELSKKIANYISVAPVDSQLKTDLKAVSNISASLSEDDDSGAGGDKAEGSGDAVDESRIDHANLMQIMGCIEAQANELLMSNFMMSMPKRSDDKELTTAAITAPASIVFASGCAVVNPSAGLTAPIGNISIQAPSTGDDYESDNDLTDEDERPLTREELEMKGLRGISRREKMPHARPNKPHRARSANRD